jgi:DNA replication protein DnaC
MVTETNSPSELIPLADGEVELPPRPCPDCGAEMTLGFYYGQRPVYSHLKDCEALGERLRREDETKQRRAFEVLRERRAGLPEPGAGLTLETFPDRLAVDKCNKHGLGTAIRFVAACADDRTPKTGITYCGAFGSGKTTLLVALGRSLARAQVDLLFVNLPEELERLKGLMKTGRLDDRLRELQRVRVLLLDDLGRERASAWSVDQILYPLVDARYRAGLPTICSTNETLDTLQAQWEKARGEDGERAGSAPAVLDRLKERSPWLSLGGASRRKPEVDF